MSTLSYDSLALSWSIDNRANRLFNTITIIVLAVVLTAAVTVSLIDLPEEQRTARKEVPPRIVQFLLEKKKVEPKIEKIIPQPRPKPEPKPEPEQPKVEKIDKKPEADKKPLTESEKAAREVAADSGLLALSNELSDLMETDDISAMVGGTVGTAATTESPLDSSAEAALLAGSTSGSGGISNGQLAIVTTGKTVRLQRQVSTVEQTLIKEKVAEKQSVAQTGTKRKGGIRSEESVTLVFDRNKSKLFSLYNRARRKNPDLKGKVILEITIAPSGKVTKIIVVTSELNDKTLEARLLKRIKLFDFGAQPVEQVTVTYPIEFLPS